jgi:hypothetical protein
MDESRGEETPTPALALAPFVAPVAQPTGMMGFVPGILWNVIDTRQFEVDLTTSSR